MWECVGVWVGDDSMKMVMAVYNMATENEVLAAAAEVGAVNYTKVPRVVGVGRSAGPRLDDHIWPGANTLTLFVVDDALANALADTLAALRGELGKNGAVKAFVLNVERTV